jgi:hypothetical protein
MSEQLRERVTRGGDAGPRSRPGPTPEAMSGRSSHSSAPLSDATIRRSRAAIVGLAPAVVLAAHAYHPWIGSPGDADFMARLAAAVAADPVRWGISHFGVALGSGLLILAFLAVRSYLREAGTERWSALGLPFVVMGSLMYALLPAMEFTPLAALRADADIMALQGAQMAWFIPILMSAAFLFFLGVVGFAVGIARTGVLSPLGTRLVVAALVVMAITRFFPVGIAQLYVGPVAGVLALWPLAYLMAKGPRPIVPGKGAPAS